MHLFFYFFNDRIADSMAHVFITTITSHVFTTVNIIDKIDSIILSCSLTWTSRPLGKLISPKIGKESHIKILKKNSRLLLFATCCCFHKENITLIMEDCELTVYL